MSSFRKITAFFLAVVMVLCLGACVPKGATLNKEWGFKANGKEYSVGNYLLPMADAYEQLYAFYSQYSEDFDADASILDIESSSFDESGKTYTAREWIKKQTEDYIKYMVAVDILMDEYGIELGEDKEAELFEQAKMDWYMGRDYQNVIDGIAEAAPLKNKYEPLGISVESYCEVAYTLGFKNAKYNALFSHLYSKGGEKEVPQKELNKYFEENYTDYSYFIVNLHTTTEDEMTGELVNVPMDDEKQKEILDYINTYPQMAKDGASLKDIVEAHKKLLDFKSDSFVMNNMESYNDVETSLSEEVADALREMGDNEARIIENLGNNSPMALVLYKSPVKARTKEFFEADKEGLRYRSLVEKLKGQEFFDYLVSYAETIDLEFNWPVLEKFTLETIENNYKRYLDEIYY